MLDDFSREMDTTETKMDNVMKKMAKVLHMSSGINCLSICAYIILCITFPFQCQHDDTYYTFIPLLEKALV